jgi:DNA helicase-2/ATP-dependent DNA helicase PcrA
MAKRNIVFKKEVQLDLFETKTNQEFTREQKNFIEYDGNDSVVLSSCAGSGKTFSCVQRLKNLLERGVDPNRIIFFSFTRDAVNELSSRVEKEGINVQSKTKKNGIKITTIHSYCGGVLAQTGKRKAVSDFFDFIEWYKDKYKPKYGSSQSDKDDFHNTIEGLYENSEFISSSIASFKLQSAEKIKAKVPEFMTEYNIFLREKKARDFSDMLIEVRDMFLEEKWLRMFRGKYDYVFIDEYQDTSSIQLQIVLALNAKYYYLIGDKNQCVVTGTKIHTKDGVKKIEDLIVGDEVLSGKGSSILGYNKVTNIFKNKFKGEVIKIKTESGKELITTQEHTHFAKYVLNNKEWFFTYLMYKKGYGFRIGVTKSYHSRSSFEKSSRFGFMNRLNGENAQKIWLLGAFKTESESRLKEIEYSLRYQIPTIVFKSRDENGISNQEFIDLVFKNINTEIGGFKLLEEKKFDFNMPHHFPKSRNNELGDRNINICLCSDGRGLKSSHTIEISGKNIIDKERLILSGLKVQDNGKNTGWRIRNQSPNFEDLIAIKEKFLSVLGRGIENRNALLKKGNSLNFTKASYLLPGMTIYVLDEFNNIEYDVIESVNREKYDGYVYDINVENTHNFIANNIFTHNSIYGFSGSNCELLESMVRRRRSMIEMNLSVNFRSDKSIVENSNNFSTLKATAKSDKAGYVDSNVILKIDDLIELLKTDDEVAVLVRTNSVIKKLECQLLKRKIPMSYFNFISPKDIENFKKGQVTDSLKNKLSQVREYYGSDENTIAFIERFKKMNKFVTTIHKSKGREFHTCVVVNSISPNLLEKNPNFHKLSKKQIAQISFDPDDDEDVEPRNIHYVAVSRSKHKLYFMIYMTK